MKSIANTFAASLLQAFAALLLVQCNTSRSTYYAPNNVVVPALTQQHDATLNGGLALGSRHSGWELQAAYSPLKHLGVMFNHLNGQTSANSNYYYYYEDAPQKGRLKFTEGGIGAYFPTSSKVTWSCWAGYGAGSVFNYYKYVDYTSSFYPQNSLTVHADLRYRRWFVQPSVLMRSRFIRMGAALRFSRIEYTGGEIDYRLPPDELAATEKIQEKGIFFQPELAYSFQLDFRPFTLGYNFVSRIGPDHTDEYHFSGASLSVSLGVDLHAFWRKSK